MPPYDAAGQRRPSLIRHVEERLRQRQQAGLQRQRLCRSNAQQPEQHIGGQDMVSFCSNDYLGLANHPQVLAAFEAGARRYGVGSGASHLVSGHCAAHQQLEEELAAFLGRDRALLFSTGYMTNTGIINALMGPGGMVLQDQLNHASLLDGGWLSRAESRRYPHRDMAALERMLEENRASHTLLVSDGVFSMDGDTAELPELVARARRHGAWLMIDDAHGIGCLGERGAGLLEMAGTMDQTQVDILVGTLGKAFGTAGAFVAGEQAVIEYLMQFCRPYVFSTAIPAAIAEASRSSLRLVQCEPWRRERLQQLVARFRREALALDLPLTDSRTAIQAIVFGDVDTTLRASSLLARHGLHVSAIRPPTVAKGASRLRITFSAAHTDEHLERLLIALHQVQRDILSHAA